MTGMPKRKIIRPTERDRDEALDRLERAMAAYEEEVSAHPWQGRPCPTCGELWRDGNHHCKPGSYPDHAIPF